MRIDGEITPAEAQLWNRAHLKSLKLAALLAVGCDPSSPLITVDLAQWAVNFVKSGTEQVLKRFMDGDFGSGEKKQESELRRVASQYPYETAETLRGYKCKPELQALGVIPYTYFLAGLNRYKSFDKDRRGAASALQNLLDHLVLAGALELVAPSDVGWRGSRRQRLYRLGPNW